MTMKLPPQTDARALAALYANRGTTVTAALAQHPDLTGAARKVFQAAYADTWSKIQAARWS